MNFPADGTPSVLPIEPPTRAFAQQAERATRIEETTSTPGKERQSTPLSPTLIARAFLRKGTFQLNAELDLYREVTVLFGPSGAGKSLTLRILAGFEHPERGRITLDDTVLLDTENHVCVPPGKRRIGMVFQDLALFPHLTVLENVAYGIGRERSENARLAAVPAKPFRKHFFETVREIFSRPGKKPPRHGEWEQARFWLSRLGMAHFEERFPSELSGGQQQRVALARALAPEPDLLLLDEPFSALDGPVRRNLRRELRKLQRETGVPMLYVTHSVEDVCALGDRMTFVTEGRFAGTLPVEKLWGTPLSELHWKALGWGTFLRGELRLSSEGACFSWENGILRIASERLLAASPCNEESDSFYSPLGKNRKTSRAAAVFVAPQDIKLIHPDAPVDPFLETNLFKGHIVEAIHLGGMLRLTVETAGTLWQIECATANFPQNFFEEGAICRFAVPPQNIAVL